MSHSLLWRLSHKLQWEGRGLVRWADDGRGFDSRPKHPRLRRVGRLMVRMGWFGMRHARPYPKR